MPKRISILDIIHSNYHQLSAAQLADIMLCCGSNESPFQFGSIPARIAQLVLLDVLYHEYVLRNQEQCEQSLNQIGMALTNMHL